MIQLAVEFHWRRAKAVVRALECEQRQVIFIHSPPGIVLAARRFLLFLDELHSRAGPRSTLGGKSG